MKNLFAEKRREIELRHRGRIGYWFRNGVGWRRTAELRLVAVND